MAVPPTLQDRDTLAQRFIRTAMAYSTKARWYGRNSILRALAFASGNLAEIAQQLFVSLVRRLSLLGAQGEYLSQVMQEHGVERLGQTNSSLILVVRPETSVVTAITSAATDLIEVEDSSGFEVGMTLVIRSADGATTETTGAITAITTATGPNGNDELDVPSLTNSYSPGSENVEVLASVELSAGSVIDTEDGVQFETLAAITTGAANPVLSGEGTAVALLDRVWCEASTAGESGNVQAYAVTKLATAVPGIAAVYNPEPASGGDPEETDYDGRRRAATWASSGAAETGDWLAAIASDADSNVLRAIRGTGAVISRTMQAKVLKRNGAAFTATELEAIQEYIQDRTRTGLQVSLTNIELTSIEISAQITLAPGYTLQEVYREMAGRLATYLDWRRWAFGGDVEESDLLVIVRRTPGVLALVTETFTPSANVSVADDSLPTLGGLSLENTASGETIDATLTTSFASS